MPAKKTKKGGNKNVNPPEKEEETTKVEAAPEPTPEPGPTGPAPEKNKTEPPKIDPNFRKDRLRQKPLVSNPDNVYKGNVPAYDVKLQKLFEAPNGDVLVGGIKDKTMPYRIPGGNKVMKILPMRRLLTPAQRDAEIAAQKEAEKEDD